MKERESCYPNLRVLVAEDESIVRETLTEFLAANGLEVFSARNGMEAVQKMEDLGGDVDLLILDVTMPGLSGFEAYEEITTRFGPKPVIFSSGYGKERTFHKAPPDIPRNFIQKPYPLEELLGMIRGLVLRDED